LIKQLGYAGAERVDVTPTGAERIATWINQISPVLLILGVLGIYLEFKTPGFGLPGVVGLIAFGLYFFGGYIAGLSGAEGVLVFLLGLGLLALELFVFPGTVVLGFVGAGLIFASIVMAMVDLYPGGPIVPTLPQLRLPLQNLAIAVAGAGLLIGLAGLWIPKTELFRHLVSRSASGESSVSQVEKEHSERGSGIGVTLAVLHPGGKARFGDEIVDVISQGEIIAAGTKVRVIGRSGHDSVVEPA
jgi:membrane-bound serine protease (ClpP class)